MVNFNPLHKEFLDFLLLTIPGVDAGKMFGYPAYYVKGKLFACVFEAGVGVKVPADFATKKLEEKYIIPFQPFGRPKMKEWIQINHDKSEKYNLDKAIFLEAINFVSAIKKK